MKKKTILFLVLLLALPLFAQDKNKDTKDSTKETTDTTVADTMYQEQVLEDFESSTYNEENIKFRVVKRQKAGLMIRDQYPVQNGISKKYLGVKVFGKSGDYFTIIPAKPLKINKFCRSISIWVYGKNFSGTLSFIITDADQNSHKVLIGNLAFPPGWKKMTINIDSDIKQQDEYLNQKSSIEITKIIYEPGNTVRPAWQYFYLDDITAMVREKYTDRQSDDW